VRRAPGEAPVRRRRRSKGGEDDIEYLDDEGMCVCVCVCV
jgi:hypothetical protein